MHMDMQHACFLDKLQNDIQSMEQMSCYILEKIQNILSQVL